MYRIAQASSFAVLLTVHTCEGDSFSREHPSWSIMEFVLYCLNYERKGRHNLHIIIWLKICLLASLMPVNASTKICYKIRQARQRKWQRCVVIHGCWSGDYPQIICKSGVVSQLAGLFLLQYTPVSHVAKNKCQKKFINIGFYLLLVL